MHWVDWLIAILPIGFVVWIGIYLRRYIRGVADFVVAGRVAGRYVICVADLEIALGVPVLIALCEERYKGGFGIAFWQNVTLPIGIFTTVWFMIGGFIGLRQLFRDLANRAEDALDNGYVENNVSLADKAKVERIENAKSDR